MKYKIKQVIDIETGEKAEDKDRVKRVGREIEDLFPFEVGFQAQFINSDYSITRTSTVRDIKETEEEVSLETKNSIYVLAKIKDGA